MTLGRAQSPPRRLVNRPIVEIANDGKATLARMRTDAERLRDLGNEARAGIENAAAKAQTMLDQIFEAGAKAVCEKLDQVEKAIKR